MVEWKEELETLKVVLVSSRSSPCLMSSAYAILHEPDSLHVQLNMDVFS